MTKLTLLIILSKIIYEVKKMSLLIKYLLSIFLWSNMLFCMEMEDTEKKTNDIKIAEQIFLQNANDLKYIYELALGAASFLLKKENSYTKGMSNDLVEDALKWMGGAIDYGKDHGYPEDARKDPRFIAIHLLRAATFYMEYHIISAFYADILKKKPLDENIAQIILYCEMIINNRTLDLSDELKQTPNEIALFGEFPPFNAKIFFTHPGN